MTRAACDLEAAAALSLGALDESGLRRHLRDVERLDAVRVRVDGREVVSFASCDYLGLARHVRLAAAAADAARSQGTSSGSARLLQGHDAGVAALERELAAAFGAEDALVFASGYHANLGIITALAGPGDLLVSDRLAHASTVDACRLSGARTVVVDHSDVAAFERALRDRGDAARVLVLVEGVYSMDGDVAPLDDLSALCEEHGAHLIVDDAHGLGAFGPAGRGAAAAAGITPAVTLGNLGKALGSYGGFALMTPRLRELVLQTARSFVFTCALPPSVVAAARAALAVLADEPERAVRLAARAVTLRGELARHGLDSGVRSAPGSSPILPVILGERALQVSAGLLRRGWLAPAVRPPTVPAGSERLRLTVCAEHTDEQCRALAADVAAVVADTSPERAVQEIAP